jgi:hypothetical protein
MSSSRLLVKRSPQLVKFLECTQNHEEQCSNRDQEHEVEQQHGVTSKPVVVAGDYVPSVFPAANVCSDCRHRAKLIPVSDSILWRSCELAAIDLVHDLQ